MGGEQTAELVYGPIKAQSAQEWCKLFSLKPGEDFYGYSTLLHEYLHTIGLKNVHSNNWDWDVCKIGMIVRNFDTFSDLMKEKVMMLCIKYKLEKPTYYGGISGEFE